MIAFCGKAFSARKRFKVSIDLIRKCISKCIRLR